MIIVLSYIERFPVNPAFQKSVHLVPIAYDIDAQMQSLFQILFDADYMEKILSLELYNHVKVAGFLGLTPGKRTENTQSQNTILGGVFIFEAFQNL